MGRSREVHPEMQEDNKEDEQGGGRARRGNSEREKTRRAQKNKQARKWRRVTEEALTCAWEVEGEENETFAAVSPGFRPFAFTNPIFVDADADGEWTAPGLPESLPPTIRDPLQDLE